MEYGYPLICARWESSSASHIGKLAFDNLKKNFSGLSLSNIPTGTSVKSAIFGSLGKAAAMAIAQTTVSSTKDTADLFKKARQNARITGKILGHLLACGFDFSKYSVSLIGFSLGS